MPTGYEVVQRLVVAGLGAMALSDPGGPGQAAAPALAAVALAPAIAEAPAAPRARGVFFSRQIALDLPAGEALLASSPDGAGDLCTDDEAAISLRGPGEAQLSWAHLFADGDGRAISCIGPQPLQIERAGRYTLTITLTDRRAHTFSSRPYYLVWAEPVALGPAAPASPPLTATASPGPRPSPTPAGPTATLPASPAPTQPAAPSPARTSLPPRPPASREPSPAAPMEPWRGRPAAALATLAALALLALLWRGRRPRPALRGIVDLADRETGEARTLLLRRYPRGLAIARAPLEPLALPATPERPAAAVILPGPRGPELRHHDDGGAEGRVALRDGVELLIDRALELRYRRDI